MRKSSPWRHDAILEAHDRVARPESAKGVRKAQKEDSRPDPFHELRYGLYFFLSAAAGGFFGLTCLVPAFQGNNLESQRWKEVRGIIFGVIVGSAIWLFYKYVYRDLSAD